MEPFYSRKTADFVANKTGAKSYAAAISRCKKRNQGLCTAPEVGHSAGRRRRQVTPLVSFDHATLGYGRRVILSDLNFSIPEGDFLGIVGPNGSGKTTIPRAILRTLKPLAGSVAHADNIRTIVPQRDQVTTTSR